MTKREEFENWASMMLVVTSTTFKRYHLRVEEYADRVVHAMWGSWQAAYAAGLERAAVVLAQERRATTCSACDAFLDGAAAAIRAAKEEP